MRPAMSGGSIPQAPDGRTALPSRPLLPAGRDRPGQHGRRRAAVSSHEDLQAYVAREMSRRLDRSRPLWELHVLEGLPDGRRALWAKMHHALVDGIAAVGIALLLLDPSPEPMVLPEPEEAWQPRGYDLRRHLQEMARTPLD